MPLLLLPFTPTALRAQSPSTFKVDVKLVRLLANVKNPAGELVGSLDAKEFTVYDCGVKQEIAVFDRQTEQPLSVSVMIDASGSTLKDVRYETVSIGKFLKALIGAGNPKDMTALYSFNYEVRQLTYFTRHLQRIEESLKSIKPTAGTSLYDAIYFSGQELRSRAGRHVMIVVSDGGDTTSNYKWQDALEAAHRAEAVLYPIIVVPIENDAGRNIGGEHALEGLATRTGGRVFFPTMGAGLDKAFADILLDLRSQYLLGYYPRDLPRDAPRFHTVRVEVKRNDLQVFTRTGYYGDAIPK